MAVRIIPANLRDLSYIAANLREDDFAEIDCQLDQWTPQALAAISLRDQAYVAEINDNPEAGFGVCQVRQGYWIAWSWGTKRMGRAVPYITRFAKGHVIPAIVAAGGLRIEARALKSNRMACKWLENMGGRAACELPLFGKNGETFILYEWTAEHVSICIPPEGAEAGCCAASAAA